jgi:uncharacterized protein DUF4178
VALTPPAPPPKALTCAGCGAPLQVRAPGRSVVVACAACGVVLDAEHPDVTVIADYEQRTKVSPLLPLGRRGKIKGETYEVIGFLVRETVIAGETFRWSEYLLFNPALGFRWLTEYAGHWTLTKTASSQPKRGDGFVTYLNATYRHFQTATAKVAYVIGELPWRVTVGQTAKVEDYVDPPRILSCEKMAEETTWSIGEYIAGRRVWDAFALPGHPPDVSGVGAAQPSPFAAHARSVWLLAASFLSAAVLLHMAFAVFSQKRVVYTGHHEYRRGLPAAVVTQPFDLTGRRSNVAVHITTQLQNAWAHFNLALVNVDTGNALDFGREVSYYTGSDSDGAWSEGGPSDTVFLPSVASGRYYLLVEPETQLPSLDYWVTVRRDVPRPGYLFVALGLLVVPPLVFWYRQHRFEYRRWSESDHPITSLKWGSDDDDD